MNATQTTTTSPTVQSPTRSANAMVLTAEGSSTPNVISERTELCHTEAKLCKPALTTVVAEPASPEPVHTPARQRRDWSMALGGLVILALLVYCGTRYVAHARAWIGTDNAYLAGHIHLVSPRVSGTVQEVLVKENQHVAAGAVLARLDARDFEIQRQQAAAEVTRAAAQSQEARARIAQANAQVAHAEALAFKAKNDLSRATSLYEKGSGAISKQEFDLAQADARATEAGLQEAQSTIESANASAEAARALEQVAQANLQNAELQLSYTEILAPVAGRIGKKNLETGNRVQPGQTILALVQTDLWVTANFKETQLNHLKAGQPVQVRLDAFPGRVFGGTVESLAPASGAQFALLPPDNATGNFTKIVQRVPVKIELDRASLGELQERLVPGMSAVVEVKVND